MQNIPVDTRRVELVYVTCEARMVTDANGQRTNVQATNPDGEPTWTIQVLDSSLDDETTDRVDTTDLRFSGPKPDFPKYTALDCDGLTARAWNMNGRSGVSFSATAIRAANVSKRNGPVANPAS